MTSRRVRHWPRLSLFIALLVLWLSAHADTAGAELPPSATLGHLTSPVDTRFLAEHHLYDVTWGNGRFVAVGQAAFDETEVLLSTDGQKWERVLLGKPARPLGVSSDGVGALYGVAWNGSLFAAVGERILTSPNGKSWTVAALSSPCVFARVIAHGATFVAVGADRGRGCLVISSDGMTWTDRTMTLTGNNAALSSLVWSGSAFVALGSVSQGKLGLASVVLSSPDGVEWTRQLGPQEVLVDLAWNGKTFVAVGGSGRRGAIFTSPNARQWTERTTSVKHPLRAVGWNGGLFVAVGVEGVIATSPDGKRWTQRRSGASQDLLDLAWNGALFVIVGDGIILTSANGVQWQAAGQAR